MDKVFDGGLGASPQEAEGFCTSKKFEFMVV